jgi:RNA polymerase sigma-70 factor, ECF subfamily
MSSISPPHFFDRPAWDVIADEDVIERIRGGDIGSYEILTRRYNQRLYRVAFSILRNHAEAEDVTQEAHFHAYQHLDQFAGEAKFSTWLTKITINEALGRVRRRRQKLAAALSLDTNLQIVGRLRTEARDPERQAYDHELKLVLEHAVEALPDIYRSVLALRAVKGLSGAEAASYLGIGEDAIKNRLRRALLMLRKSLAAIRRPGSHCPKAGHAAMVATRRVGEEALNGEAEYASRSFTPLLTKPMSDVGTPQEVGADQLHSTRSPTGVYRAEPLKRPHVP